ncbi:hypothetical protein K9O30_06360 [Clostridium bowmanii]|uniref:hypothetical protein n=1 Tax=Clostridium bowmanii TaxID=132925 RepID=UPI001C0DD22F|nr:hypothetical protein [Clostridium bowmanii]MBU3188781.1 hypothetical protein [Clostridium bowmanii]MCA1073365.1 hypothetical protein [Clostridium bowmanii]
MVGSLQKMVRRFIIRTGEPANIHGDNDQIVPIGVAALKSFKFIKNSILKVYKCYSYITLLRIKFYILGKREKADYY